MAYLTKITRLQPKARFHGVHDSRRYVRAGWLDRDRRDNVSFVMDGETDVKE